MEVVMEKLSDIFERLQRRVVDGERVPQHEDNKSPRILPDRHPVRDFFVADVLDWALKDDRHSMEHPMFSLSKKPDRRERHYEHNGRHISIIPSSRGLATIWDKDILLYCISMLVEAINRGRPINRTVRLTAYDLLVATNRSTGGRAYDLLQDALNRLRGTTINTDISTNGVRQRRGFGLVDNWEIIERVPTNGRMVAVELTLNQWLYNAILAREVLTLNRDYFRLDGGLERRLYEIARKHCGNQAKWTVGIGLLHKKSGSTGPLKRFRELLKKIAESDVLPDYRLRCELEQDQATFYAKDASKVGISLAGQAVEFGTPNPQPSDQPDKHSVL
jgi:plasmid replication initiation protein